MLLWLKHSITPSAALLCLQAYHLAVTTYKSSVGVYIDEVAEPYSLAMIGLFTLAIMNESSVRRNQVQRRRWLMHAAFAYVSVTIRSAPVLTVPVVVSVRTIVNRRARRVLA